MAIEPTRVVGQTVLHEGFGRLRRVVFRRRRRDGAMVELTREILDAGDAASILPYDRARGTIILIRQFRGVAFLHDGCEIMVETCAGRLEGADPLTRIVRETEEETGIRLLSRPREIFRAYSSPGSFSEMMTFFVVPYTAAERVGPGGGLAGEGEDIEVLEMTLDAAIAMAERGEIVDTKTLLHLFWARATGLMERD